ncbi:MAG: GumC family protein [Phycisphaerales bacterium]
MNEARRRQNQSPHAAAQAEPDFTRAGGGTGHDGHDTSPLVVLMKLHRLLRGRYPLAIGLAVLGAAAGAVGGYMSATPKFQSVGAIRIQPVMPKTLYESEVTGVPPMFPSYVRTQANLLQEPRVIDRAMLSPEWKSVGRGYSPEAKEEFRQSLQVGVDREEQEWIRIRFTDVEPKAAQIAVERVIDAYKEIHGKDQNIIDPELMPRLESDRRRLLTDLAEYQRRIRALTQEAEVPDVVKEHAAKIERLQSLNDDLEQLEMRIKQMELQLAQKAKADPEKAASEPEDWEASLTEIAKADEAIQKMVDDRDAIRLRLDRLLSDGYTEKARVVVTTRSMLANMEERLKVRTKEWLAEHNGILPAGDGSTPTTATPEALENLKANVSVLRGWRDSIKETAFRLGEKRDQIAALQDEMRKTQEEIDRVDTRLRQLGTEIRPAEAGGLPGRIRIVSVGEVPFKPSSDPRRKLAISGFILGAGIPIGLMMLWGLLDRRYRYSDDTTAGAKHPTLLGILPYLPERMNDPEQAGIAAHCVHQIRAMLQIGAHLAGRKVFAVTSPTAGDGKTSLSLSLGLSFAASGAKTCLIDFDMIGGGLTSAMQAKTDEGLMDAVMRGQLNGHIRESGFPKLWMVPIGRDDARDVSALSPTMVRRIIEQAKEKFDIVVIDTGPILGSLEASLVCASADGTIVALGRGQQRGQVDRAMEVLQSIGAHCLGVVFNRADPRDFRRAVSSASVRSRPVAATEERQLLLPAMGPMARTVASHMRPETPATDGSANASDDNKP